MSSSSFRKPQRHEEIANILRKELLRENSPGRRLMPDPAQAKRLGVSVITLRDAMRILVKEGLLERRRGSGTYVKDRNSSDILGRVAIIAAEDWFSRSSNVSFQHLLMHALQEQLRQIRLLPDIHYEIEDDLSDESVLRQTSDAPLVGIIILKAKDDLSRLNSFGVPIVSGTRTPRCDFSVKYDHEGLIRESVRHLIEAGRRRIALLTLRKTGSAHSDIDDWIEELFMASLAQHGVDFRPELVASIGHDDAPGTIFNTVQGLWESSRQAPDGLLVADDSIYSEAAMAILKMGIKVPDELMVVTHDNIGSDMFCPFPTTRFTFDPRQMAREMVDKLELLIKGESIVPPFKMLSFQIIEPGRSSKKI